MAPLLLTALSNLVVTKHHIPAHGLLPNSAATKRPLIIYRGAFTNAASATSSKISSHLRATGVVTPHWTYTMYSTDHFHSTTHEVLCVCQGTARLCFGGRENPGRQETVVQKGDVIVVPAGVTHSLLEDLSRSEAFQMVGSYPSGVEEWDMCYGREGEEEKVAAIKGLQWFSKDPLYGDEGPVLEFSD